MKNSRKLFLAVEAALATITLMVIFIMMREKGGQDLKKVSVVIQNSDDSQWAAFRYGLKMAARDQRVELNVASTRGGMAVAEIKDVLLREIEHGADAVIVQPSYGPDMEELLIKIDKKVPVMLVGDTTSEEGAASSFPSVEPDHYAVGEAVAAELLEDYNQNLAGKSIGIVAQDGSSQAAASRRDGFLNALDGFGASICWEACGPFGQDGETNLEHLPKADFVIALDNYSLIAAGECAAANNLHGALVYGVGDSTEAVYYLDTGIARCLVVPDGFSMGYQSLSEAAQGIRSFFHKMEGQKVPYTVMRRDMLFDDKNQEILFTMSQ